MENVLVASLGRSPVVITAMVKALLEHPDGPRLDRLHRVCIIYLGQERLIDFGADLVEDHLKGVCSLDRYPIPFADIDKHESAVTFLHYIHGIMEANSCNQVYLSLAGGRKNMSALIAVAAQFYHNVRALYHILDRNEHNHEKRNFFTLEELFNLDDDDRTSVMRPSMDDLKLVQIPFAPLVNSDQLGGILASLKGEGENLPLDTTDSEYQFTKNLFTTFGTPAERLTAWLSEQALRDYSALGAGNKEQISSYVRNLSDPEIVRTFKRPKFKDFDTDCVCYPGHRARAPLRIFFTVNHEANRLCIHRILLHGQYMRMLDGNSLYSSDHPAAITWEPTDVLVVPLGKSPMVATQIFTLLRSDVNISCVCLIYPEKSGVINNNASLLEKMFSSTKFNDIRQTVPINVRLHPIAGIDDVDSYQACGDYMSELKKAIDGIKREILNPHIYLVLAGGRKSMAALSYYVAQECGLPEVYHTLIDDPKLEDRVERETTPEAMNSEGLTPKQMARRLFLLDYATEKDNFCVVRVPVIIPAKT